MAESYRGAEPVRIRRRALYEGRRIGDESAWRWDGFDTRHLAWQEDAACLGVDPEAFFPVGDVSGDVLRLCDRCPVTDKCLSYALEQPRLHGIWGGTTEDDRKFMHDAGVVR